MKNKIHLILFSILLLNILGCENPETINTKISKNNDKTGNANAKTKIDNLGYNLVYTKYKIPLPLDIFTFLEKYSQFNNEYLNPIENKEKYFSEIDKAINLGIYTTDLVYCNIFTKSDLTLEYFETARIIANSINIQVGYTEDFIKRLESNSNNKDSLIKIVDESYWKACNNLENSGQNNILPFIVFGNWIEGVYIISQSKESVPETRIKEHILNKKEGLDNIINYLYDVQIESSAFYYTDDLKINIKKLDDLKSLYENYELENSNDNYLKIENEIIKIRNIAIQF